MNATQIDTIIKEAEETADIHFNRFMDNFNQKLKDRADPEKYIKEQIENEATNDEKFIQFYDVRDNPKLRGQINMQLISDGWPVIGAGRLKLSSGDKTEQLISILWPLFLRMNKIDYLKGLLNLSQKPESNKIDEILNSMFEDFPDFKLITLKSNLNGKDTPIELLYKGVKDNLWFDLGQLIKLGINRNEIARVFSKYCLWQRTPASEQKKLDPDEIYNKAGKKKT